MIRTGISRTETRALQAFAEGRRVIECGALLGYSTLALAAVAAHVVSIDRHEGYGPSTLRPFLSNIDGHRDRISPLVGDARLVLPALDVKHFGQFDEMSHSSIRYFLDLDGGYENTRAVLAAIPRGRPVAIHDCNRQSCGGVLAAIRAEGYDISHVVETLAIIGRRAP